MKYKIMLIDDSIHQRGKTYRQVLSSDDFELVVIESAYDFEERFSTTPVDGYIVDVVLDQGSWHDIGNAGELFSRFRNPPRGAPVFLVSMKWGEPETINALNTINQITDLDVLRYLTWPEFERAAIPEQELELHAFRGKVLDDLAIWHRRSTFQPKDNQIIRILVLADLQYGDPHTSDYAAFSEQWVSRTLKKNSHLPDLVVFAGDIAYSGAPSEYKQAKERLEGNLLKELWPVSELDNIRERVLVVPGNHDVNMRYLACNQRNWNVKEKAWELITPSQQVTKVADDDFALEPFRQFAADLTGARKRGVDLAGSHVDRRFEGGGLRFYLLNSTRHSSVENPKHAEFGKTELETINRGLKSGDKPEEFFNVVISHHGIQTGGSNEQISDWRNVGEQFFSMNHVGLWIFGHYHKDKLGQEGAINLLQAPTLRIVPGESTHRGFTLIELTRSDGKVTGGNVHFYKFDDTGALLNGKPDCKPLIISQSVSNS